MKLHANETVLSSHPVLISDDGRVLKLILVTSFGRVFHFWTDTAEHHLLSDALAS